MALYELDAPHGGVTTGLLSRIKSSVGRNFRAMQYARMVEVMRRMREQDLETLGLTRADIPRHARECIYGEQD